MRLFSSESVTEGHPDKVCDIISDSILDAIIAQDPMGRVACETFATTGLITVMGEMSFNGNVDYSRIVRKAVKDIGYDSREAGFDGDSCGVLLSIDEQSPDIAMGVNAALEKRDGATDELASTGAGDQGMMFGYACSETDSLMPAPIEYAHRLTRRLAALRKDGTLPFLRPDGKSMVTVEYDDRGNIVSVPTVVLSTQHSPEISLKELTQAVVEQVIKPVLPGELIKHTRYLVNPTGRFVVGGPHGDTGLTGRKIIVDTYGGYARHGGGAFSGKDPTKVDRSAAYMARYMAKNIVASGLAERCEIELAYAIGVAEPVSVLCETFGTGKTDNERLAQAVRRAFDMRPEAIIRRLDLRRPIYTPTAAYGHFGRTDVDLPWERTDMTEALKALV
ncbi:MAG: methionine adenosyltransferase [Oscillospiraceae bacterium]|nr:MAG: methionine adenosyltransferase [Oscillospiraceae bacterium]